MDEARRTNGHAEVLDQHYVYRLVSERSASRSRAGGASETSRPLRPHHQKQSVVPDGDSPRLRQVLDALPVAVYLTDAQGVVTFANQAAADLVGRQPRIGQDRWCVSRRAYLPDGSPLEPSEAPMAIALRENRSIRNVEVVLERADGGLVSVLPFPTPLSDGEGKVIGGVNTLLDITERKQAEAGQFGLLRELNHRVKNNMQMLLSLLASAARESATAEARTVLSDAGHRVAVMGAVQQVLYGGDGSGIAFSVDAMLHAVAASAAHSPSGPMEIDVVESGIILTNDLGVPLALMLNELLSNVAKYAGRDGTAPIARISLGQAGERFALTVEDNGPGFEPDHANGKRASGLGLVRGLARQLGGTLTVERDPTARCVVTFSDRSMH